MDQQIYLIVGLGNLGQEYALTRHNLGFLVLDELACQHGVVFKNVKRGMMCEYAVVNEDNVGEDVRKRVILLKPKDGMNLSGLAIRYWMDFYQIPISRVLIVCDDLNLPFGKIRLRDQGSAGGHNGLRHIQQMLSTTSYARLQFGIGQSDVLGKWTPSEISRLRGQLDDLLEMISSFIFG